MESIRSITSWDHLTESTGPLEKAYLLLYRSGSEQSECAYRALAAVAGDHPGLSLFAADVTTVRDIHEKMSITTVPVLVELEHGAPRNVIKGCQQAGFLKAFFDEELYVMQARKEGKEPKRVTVYTSPTCSWCSTLKAYLRKNNIRYREVDISRDERAAQDLVRRSGQQGVPQTDINGQIVVGFNQGKLDQLLEINQ